MTALKSPVLVLNKSWTPITVVSARRALCMLVGDIARVVDADDYTTYDFESWADLGEVFEDGEFILTSKMKIPVPDVLVLDEYDRVPTKKVTFSRRNIYRRDDYTCQYCGKKPKMKELTIDHILAKSKGGKTTWLNCVLACFRCNHKKGDKTLEEVGMKLVRQPTVPPSRRVTFAVPLTRRKVSWDQFLNNKKVRDAVASDVYWNAKLKE